MRAKFSTPITSCKITHRHFKVTTNNFIILAAGKPHNGEQPVLLTKVTGTTLFDWNISAISGYDSSPQVVVGYAASEIQKLSSLAKFRLNTRWETSGSGYSLLCADLS